MKKILLLLAAVGVIFTACDRTDGFDDSKNGMPTDEIWYTSTDGAIVKPRNSDVFGASIVSNTYEDGKGVIKFDRYITNIGYYAFSECISLTSITIPDRVISIGRCAFSHCTSLTSVTIGNSVTSIGIDAFFETSLTSITIPDSVTEIGYGAFTYCYLMTNVEIGNSVTSIGQDAFYGCYSLESVTIPDSVTNIGVHAFTLCGLTAFYGKFASSDNCCLITYGVLNSFARGSSGRTSYTIPNSVSRIGRQAFYCCTLLTSVTIPDSVTEIWGEAFYYCTSLTNITIPDSVTSIGDYAFDECDSLAEVYCKPTTPPTGGCDMFGSNASVRKIYVPAASVEAYKSAEYWRDYADDIVGYDF